MAQFRQQFDVLVLADMTRGGDVGLRIRRELQALARHGYRCALRHLPADAPGEVSPDVQRSVLEGLAVPLGEDAEVTAKLAIVHSPGALCAPVKLSGMTADRVVLVVDDRPSLQQMGLWLNFAIGPTTWAPTNRWVRGGVEELGFPVPVAEEDWRAIAAPCRPRPDRAPLREAPVLGLMGTGAVAGEGSQRPDAVMDPDPTHGASRTFDIWTLGTRNAGTGRDGEGTRARTVLDPGGISVERFLEAIDALACVADPDDCEVPETAIVTAMVSGKPAILPPRYRLQFGAAAVYAEPADATEAARAILSDATALQELRQAAVEHCRWSNSEAAYLGRIEALIGPPEAPGPARGPQKPRRGRVLFVPSGGVGLGHTARLLAIARRLDHDLEPVFASLGQAGDVFDAFGYRSEYIPSASDTGAPQSAWDRWFRYELGEIMDRYDPDVVAFDGNNPTHGLVRAVLAHGAARFVWVRRGMGPETPSPYLDNARFFDCIIEPGEYARDLDRGPTARLRHQVVEVPPIRLLDDAEILPRDAARREMGLDAQRPAVLVQPGSGANRDIVDLTDRLVTDLRRFDDLQIVIAEWSNGAIMLPHWPGTRRLRGFPISRYFAAFDFSVSAAGYNTFHEVIAHGLPTIFVANRHPSMDDQGARAEFAQDHGVGFDLKEEEMHFLPTLCRAMLNPEANRVLRAGCAGFDRTNGAAEAAAIIAGLAETPA